MTPNIMEDIPQSVSVYVRVKPLASGSTGKGRDSHSHCSDNAIKYLSNSISIQSKSIRASEDLGRTSTFTLSNCNGVIGGSTRDVFSTVEVSNKYIDECIQNRKPGLICCYGQSSSGKTYTMFGGSPSKAEHQDVKGLVYFAMEYIFSLVEIKNYRVALKAFEIYDERVIDLIPCASWNEGKRETTRKMSSNVDECNKVNIHNISDFESVLRKIDAKRSICATSLNQTSSRSHGFVRIFIEVPADGSLGSISSLTFVDLAGSERQSKTKSSGNVLKEGIRINKSLLTLGAVVRSLSNPKECHVPWRESKLTTVLHPHLHKNANVGFILCISSEDRCLAESISTLRFGAMLMNLRLNEVTQDCMPHTPQTPMAKPDLGCSAIESDGKIGVSNCDTRVEYLKWKIFDLFLCLLLGSANSLLLWKCFVNWRP